MLEPKTSPCPSHRGWQGGVFRWDGSPQASPGAAAVTWPLTPPRDCPRRDCPWRLARLRSPTVPYIFCRAGLQPPSEVPQASLPASEVPQASPPASEVPQASLPASEVPQASSLPLLWCGIPACIFYRAGRPLRPAGTLGYHRTGQPSQGTAGLACEPIVVEDRSERHRDGI